MGIQSTNHNIDTVKEQVINTSLVVSSFLGAAAYVVSYISRFLTSGFNISVLFESLVLVSLFIITIRRKHLSNSIKAYLMVSLLLLISLTDAYFYGLISATRIYLVLVPLYAIIYFPFIRSLIIYLVAIVGFIFIGYYHSSGVLSLPEAYEPNTYLMKLSPWIINGLHIFAVGLIILYVTRKFFNAFSELVAHLQHQNKIISENERNYKEIFNSTNEAIFIHNEGDGKFLDVNDVMLRMFGYDKKEDVLNLTVNDISVLADGDADQRAKTLIRKAVEEGPQVFEWLSKRKNGEIFASEISLKSTEIGGKGRVLAVLRDISERKKAEEQLEKYRNHLELLVQERTEELEATNEELFTANEELINQREELETILNKLQTTQRQLIQSEKMASIGILATGIAHEINNPLNFISGGTEAIKHYISANYEPSTELSELIELVNEGIKRATNIVSGLNHYSKRNDQEFTEIDLHKIIENCLIILNNKTQNTIAVEKRFTSEPFEMKCNEGKIHQALLNVLTNAVQSFIGKGSINIETHRKKHALEIVITDSGNGIAKQDLSKIFDPFFTTKEPGEGTGLGLFITHSIIEEHGGSITIDSKPEKGTRVTIVLPAK